MDPKPGIKEVEEAKASSLSRVGDEVQETKLTRSILLKLDTRCAKFPGPPFFVCVCVCFLLRSNILTSEFIRILPMLALLFLCSFLDRTNVGNAKIYGLEKDLNISDHQYDIGLTVFYLTYVCRYRPIPPPFPPLHTPSMNWRTTSSATPKAKLRPLRSLAMLMYILLVNCQVICC